MIRPKYFFLSAGVIIFLVALGLAVSPAMAAPRPANISLSAANSAGADNSLCLSCHNQPGMSIKLDSGETLPLTINGEAFAASVHGKEVACTTCHTDITGFPHPARAIKTARDAKLQYSAVCQQCHADQFKETQNGIHQKAMAGGNTNVAVCADCHNPHTQKPVAEVSRAETAQICGQCHSAILNEYKQSVHGAPLFSDNNPDVPTCIDCHGNHSIADPTIPAFCINSPEMCAKWG